MTKVAWLTDIHLTHLNEAPRIRFLQDLRDLRADVVLVSGDIAESPTVVPCLRQMLQVVGKPVYFVLGNHDYYHGGIEVTRSAISRLAQEAPLLTYLTSNGVIELSPGAGLVGHDGWADARLGDFDHSDVELNDYVLIEDLACLRSLPPKLYRSALRERLESLGDEAARHFRVVLPQALSRFPRVIALTHVPPFREACRYGGRISDDNWLPHFSCAAVGEALLEIMRLHPDRELLVLCGHTHGAGEYRPLPNLHVLTGGADYGRPKVQRVFELV